MNVFNFLKKQRKPLTALSMMKALQKKPIYQYKMLERFNIVNWDEVLRSNGEYGKHRILEENGSYLFYGFTPKLLQFASSEYVLRQSKVNPSELVFFGESRQMSFIYCNHLFQVNHSIISGNDCLLCKNIETGEIKKYSWFRAPSCFNGHFMNYDYVNDVFLQNGKLIFDVGRYKGDFHNRDDAYNGSPEYFLSVEQIDGLFEAKILPVNESEITSQQSTSSELEKVQLGFDSSKQLFCQYKDRKECPDVCSKCAIHIKETADIALSQNKVDEAATLYKKAAFIEPNYVEVWFSLGKIYKQKDEYKKALDAFERAISIDKTHGEAIFEKAIVLQKLGRLEEALNVTKDLLSMYNNPDVISFKKELIDLGAKDVLRIDDAIDIMTNKAREIASENDLLDENGKVRTERAIYKKNEFAKQIFDYCKKKYASLGEEKVRSESIITAFYASLCTTLFYYKDKDGFENINPFEYIKDHIDLEKADATAERMLEMKSGDTEAEILWNMIYDYAQFSGNIISQVDADDVEAAIVDATESAYVLGMLYAMRFAQKQTSNGRKSIGFALEKSAESSKDYAKSSPRSTTDTISTTKTKLELDALTFKYLTIISEGYESGDFSQLFPFLSRNCVFESQWVMTPNEGFDAVVSYLTEKGKTLKKTGSFLSCSIQELVGNINAIKNIDVNVKGEKQHGSIGLYYHAGELCLLMEQTIGDNSNGVILRIKLDEKEKIFRIDLCMPELFQYREFYTFVSLYPCNGEEELETGRIRVSEPYYSELYLFLGMTGEEFDEYDDIHIPMEKWIKFLDNWKRFYSFKTFDEAFEDACGIDYNEFTVKDEEARRRLSYSGSNIWKNRSNNSNMLNDLLEWTEKYKDTCDYINSYGF